MPTLSKPQVAVRTLAGAVRLFFEDRDEVVTHTVVGAAQGLLRDLAKARKLEITSILHDHPALRQELKRDWFALLNGPRNFFKHADSDADELLEFDGVYNDIFLLDAVSNYAQLGLEPIREAAVFAAWVELKYPGLRGAFPHNPLLPHCESKGMVPEDKQSYLLLCSGEA
jgi:hypothetical protein